MNKTKHPPAAVGFLLIALTVLMMLVMPLFPVKLDRQVDLASLNRIEAEHMLLYFGYPGCDSACPTTLTTLSQVYNSYTAKSDQAQLSIIFVNLIPTTTLSASQAYASTFHPNIKAVQFDPTEMQQAKTLFHLKFTDLKPDGQLFHRGYTYLLGKDKDQQGEQRWRIKEVYTAGVPDSEVVLNKLLF